MRWKGDVIPFTEAAVRRHAPAASGVYALWVTGHQDAVVCYVGDTDDLRRCLLEHRRELGTCLATSAPTACGFELLDARHRARRRRDLVRRFRPICSALSD